jgi:hypothetical protein
MSINIKWYNEEQTILLITFSESWEVIDYITMLDESRAMSREVTHPYVSVVDFRKSKSTPARLLSTGDKMSDMDNAHLPVVTILIGLGRLNELMLNIITRIYPRAVKDALLVHSWEEALTVAEQELNKANPSKNNR